MRSVRAAVCIATATVLLSVAAANAAASVPTLGVRGNHPTSSGFGQVEPRTIDYGGDPTSFVSDVNWQSWGGPRAVGQGRALWVWPGWCVACGGVVLPATVVAFGRTTCQGHSAYAYVEWFFPSRGMRFNRRLASTNICGGASPPGPPGSERSCGQVAMRSGGAVVALAQDIDTFEFLFSCRATRQFVANSGAARYLGRNARFTMDGWWCGSELLMDFGGLQSFSCERGDFTTVNFELKPA
jgi:hypothetical protein